MSADKPTRRIDNDDKQVLFVVGAIGVLLHLSALVILLLTGRKDLLIAVAFIDAAGALVAGLVWLARRIFPTEEGR